MFLTPNEQHRPELDKNSEASTDFISNACPREMPRISSSLEKYGWFEDVDNHPHLEGLHDDQLQQNFLDNDDGDDDHSGHRLHEHELKMSQNPVAVHTALSLPLPLTEPPSYILESPLTSQHLWYTTAGTRPQQPPEERKRLEQIWTENFMTSSIQYPESVLAPANKSEEKAERIQSLKTEFQEEVKGRGKGPFSNAVSKSFMNHCISCMTIQVPRFKVVRPLPSSTSSTLGCNFHAQFLIVISLGSVPHGVWRRHSDFKDLFNKVNKLNSTPGPYEGIFKNTILSW
eukprot:CAMPEP_0114415620 /NCGR_PEP_ID=MMETSP0103-20121206/2003_1 /TAXON_ID=37642 ORGANISM="Paraphysomonas imperforata, Strain PA2" /NCGR_SAMPLE_ID=MMETSP0103 /ASSEMBLY_ACC=CAM_ASM_000201 /LENGTH=286 /DNA_ID=CAMNT_0001583809 /DNA_START=126 /DNA_END=983 /DNA_ORIENTATION=-